MGTIFAAETQVVDTLIDILCDLCGQTTRDAFGSNYEYAKITANWGYGSHRDGESWDYYLCEACCKLLPLSQIKTKEDEQW